MIKWEQSDCSQLEYSVLRQISMRSGMSLATGRLNADEGHKANGRHRSAGEFTAVRETLTGSITFAIHRNQTKN